MPQGAAGHTFSGCPRILSGSAYLHNACRLHDRRSLLPARKAGSLGSIGIDARESLPVRIVNGYLPMTMLSTPVLAQRRSLFGFLQGFFQLWSQKYLKFFSPPQAVTH
jgi:hypothetical protein